VVEYFAMQDKYFCEHFLTKFNRSIFDWKYWCNHTHLLVQGALGRVKDCLFIMDVEEEDDEEEDFPVGEDVDFQPITRQSSQGFVSQQSDEDRMSDEWVVDEIHYHYGAKVAMYFAFIDHYSANLHILMYIGTLLYITVRFIYWPGWMVVVSLYGFAVPAVWAPVMIRLWEQKASKLCLRWGIPQGKHIVDESFLFPNPGFDPGMGHDKPYAKMDPISQHKAPTYKTSDRKKWILPAIIFLGLCCCLIPCIITPFIQWYAWAKMTYTCEKATELGLDAKYFWNCFSSEGNTVGTDRWLYILIQGIIMGLIADVALAGILAAGANFFISKENYATEGEHEKAKISKRWYFEYIGMYYWFIYMALVYVGYGEEFQQWLCQDSSGTFLTSNSSWICWTHIEEEMWSNEKIMIDEFFVTPLVATQAINLVLETMVPYLLNRVRGRMHEAGEKDDQVYTEIGQDMAKYLREALHLSEDELPCIKRTGDFNNYSSTELQVEASLEPYDPFGDYMDLSMQCGYVLLFSIAWPLTSVCASVNNVLETRADFFKLTQMRRPTPRTVTGIGQWIEMFKIGVYIAIVFTSLFFTMSTGGLEHFIPGCSTEYWDGREIMRPTYDNSSQVPEKLLEKNSAGFHSGCPDTVPNSSTRLGWAIATMCFVNAIAYLTFKLVEPILPEVRKNLETLEVLKVRHTANHKDFIDISDELLLSIKHAFMHVSSRWRTIPAKKRATLDQFPQLKDPLNGLVKVTQVGDVVSLVLDQDLTEEQTQRLQSEADLDEDGMISFAELACLFSPLYTSPSLKQHIPAMADPQSNFKEVKAPPGLEAFMVDMRGSADE